MNRPTYGRIRVNATNYYCLLACVCSCAVESIVGIVYYLLQSSNYDCDAFSFFRHLNVDVECRPTLTFCK